jgi:hypothetical protein
VDGIYIDQVCGADSYPCYAEHHEHKKPNQAWAVYRSFLEQLRHEVSNQKAEIFLATEGVNDFLGQYFDSLQSHQDWISPLGAKGVPLPELIRFSLPGHLLNVGCIRGDQTGTYYLRLAHLLGGGCDFGVWDWRELPKVFVEEIRYVLSWHERNYDLLNAGEMLPDIACDNKNIQANAFYSPTQVVVCAVLTDEDSEGMAKFSVPMPSGRSVRGVYAFDGRVSRPIRWQDIGSSVEFAAPIAGLMSFEVKLA